MEAVAWLRWPDGRWDQAAACEVDMIGRLRASLAEGVPILIEPILDPLHYLIVFDRIGRRHDVPPLRAFAAGLGALADEIIAYALQFLGSRDIAAVIDLETGTGNLVVGRVHNGGDFTFAVLDLPAAGGDHVPDGGAP